MMIEVVCSMCSRILSTSVTKKEGKLGIVLYVIEADPCEFCKTTEYDAGYQQGLEDQEGV